MDEIQEAVCYECVGDSYLQRQIIGLGTKGECLVCGKHQFSIELEKLANEVGRLLQETIEEGGSRDIRNLETGQIITTVHLGTRLSWYIREILRVDDEDDFVVQHIQDKLMSHSSEEPGFFDAQGYAKKTIVPFEAELNWAEFENELKHKSRFFNQKAKAFLQWLFEGINSYRVWGFGEDVVRMLRPNHSERIYRARDCTSPKVLSEIIADPNRQLGAPPKKIAPSGRMSPAGVPVFYGAFERETCIAELRPPVGGKVISGQFRLTRPVRVLDFTALEDAFDRKVVSFFDPTYHRVMGRRQFLQGFHSIISRAVLPNQENEYLKTQVIAEYLATQHSPNIEGVIFSSAQHEGGKNIVFFSQVISTDPVPPAADGNGFFTQEGEIAEPGIEFVQDSLMVHDINRVKFNTGDTRVIDGQMESDIDAYNEREF